MYFALWYHAAKSVLFTFVLCDVTCKYVRFHYESQDILQNFDENIGVDAPALKL